MSAEGAGALECGRHRRLCSRNWGFIWQFDSIIVNLNELRRRCWLSGLHVRIICGLHIGGKKLWLAWSWTFANEIVYVLAMRFIACHWRFVFGAHWNAYGSSPVLMQSRQFGSSWRVSMKYSYDWLPSRLLFICQFVWYELGTHLLNHSENYSMIVCHKFTDICDDVGWGMQASWFILNTIFHL